MPSSAPSHASVAVIGAGPAGLMAAEVIAAAGVAVTVFDRMPSPGRKFLMAGRGGLNLTHSEDLLRFLARYGEAADFLKAAVQAFSPADLRRWAEELGQPTFVGTSGRVFPRAFKASPLLRAWLERLRALGVAFRFRARFVGWAEGVLQFETPDGIEAVQADASLLALGGASWPRLGSDGAWVAAMEAEGVRVTPLAPANCGLRIAWSAFLRERFAGTPLKRIALTHAGQTVRGEAIITEGGIEGGAVYALSAAIRETLAKAAVAEVRLALRPDMAAAELAQRLAAPRGKQSLAAHLRKRLALSPAAIALLNEVAGSIRLRQLPPVDLAALVNAVPLRVEGLAAIDRAISTAGGIARNEVDGRFMLRQMPGVFVAGEMLDWEAPTGGYLLQAAFATGAAAGGGALDWLGARSRRPSAVESKLS